MIMKKEIEIEYKDFNNEYYIVFLRRGKINLFMDFGVCAFEGEMEYLDMPTQLINYKGEYGFLFNKEVNKSDVEFEVKRFANCYDI